MSYARIGVALAAAMLFGSTADAQTIRGGRDAAARRVQGRERPVAESRSDGRVPAGTVRVAVEDERGAPLAGATVRIGVMRQGGAREEYSGATNAEGVFEQESLPTGTGQAYRVTLDHEGARYGTTPFRLESDRGQFARVRRLPVTRSQDAIVMNLGEMMLEYKPDRVRITEQVQLANAGDQTVVFGEGVQMSLPAGFTYFQSRDVMTDQRIVPNDEGFELEGSLPPGTVNLVWAYDVPLEGAEFAINRPLPFHAMRYSVITDASEDMSLNVDGFPEPQRHEVQGRNVLLTTAEAAPDGPPLRTVSVSVRGIPSAGPLRYIAVGAMFMLLMLGFLLVTRTESRKDVMKRARNARRTALLHEAEELQGLLGKGEVGPKFHARRMSAIVDELASLQRLEEAGEANKSTEGELDAAGVAVGIVGLCYVGALYGTFISMQYYDFSPPIWFFVGALAFPVALLAVLTRTTYWSVVLRSADKAQK